GGRRQSDGIRAKIHLTFAVTDRERRPFARPDQKIVLAGEQKRQRESTAELLEGRRYGVGRRFSALHFLRYQMGDSLGIGLADEFTTTLGQLLTQLAEIFNDAVVNDRNRFGRMRMGIVFGRSAMACPTRVPDADIPGERLTLEPRFQRAHLAFRAP